MLNVIRENASALYRDKVPEITNIKDLPKVGDVLVGYPALCNEFVSALINRIALVKVKSATFNNMFADLKKVSDENNVDIELTISADKSELPKFMLEYIA